MENIAILTGGDSAEYNISLLSAKTVLENLDPTKYMAMIVHLKNDTYTIDNQTLNVSDFSYIKDNKKIIFDKIFIALHGPPAENGLIQDYFDNINIPYTSCNAKVSALTFDKFACNNKLKTLGFKCAESILIKSNTELTERLIVQKIGLPCFIKPNGSGSSYGISKVKKRSDFR